MHGIRGVNWLSLVHLQLSLIQIFVLFFRIESYFEEALQIFELIKRLEVPPSISATRVEKCGKGQVAVFIHLPGE